LAPVVTLSTRRTPYVLYDDEGVAFAELVDDTVSVMDGDQAAARFRELEVEALVEGADLSGIADHLITLGAEPNHSSKAASALGPATADPADIPEPEDVGPDDPAGAAVTAYLRTHARAFLHQDVRVRRDLPDSVHQMRVAARRLRSGLKTFAPLIDRAWADQLRSELGWAAGELGNARDTEVLLERLDAHAEDLGPCCESVWSVPVNMPSRPCAASATAPCWTCSSTLRRILASPPRRMVPAVRCCLAWWPNRGKNCGAQLNRWNSKGPRRHGTRPVSRPSGLAMPPVQ
jgi:inorganic triphosphatase YgiF